MFGVNHNAARSAKSLDREGRSSPDDLNALVFGFSVGINAQVDGHAEQIEILRDFSGYAESRSFFLFRFLGSCAADTVGGVLYLELGCAGGIEPLREKPGELFAVVFLGDGLEVVHARGLSRELLRELAH